MSRQKEIDRLREMEVEVRALLAALNSADLPGPALMPMIKLRWLAERKG